MSPPPPQQSVAILGTRGYPSYYGGFETAVRKLAPFLADAGWDVTVYGRHGSTKPDDPHVDRRVHSVITRGTESKALSTLTYGFWSAIDAWRRRPDVALVMNIANGFWLPLLKLRGIPTVVNVDGIEWDRAKWGRIAKLVFKAGARLTAWFADEIVVDSHEIGRRWREDFRRDGVYAPYGGDECSPLPVEPGLVSGGYALVVARFVPENSIEEFLDAVPSLAEQCDVVIVGSSGYGGEIEDRVRAATAHSRVHWLGHIQDDTRLLALWQHAGAYFHGHSVGGTNPALVQAMASGAPIVARDTPFNREVLADAGVFVEPEPADIVRAVRDVMTDASTRDRMTSRGRTRVREIFNWPAVNATYEATLRAHIRRPSR